MIAAERAGKNGAELQAIEDTWTAQAGLKLFNDAVVDTITAGPHPEKKALVARFLQDVKGKSNTEARAIAKGITGIDISWDWDSPRTREGYYRLQGGCECAINRAIAYGPYADAIWMESKLPDYAQAEQFANGVHAVLPEQKYVPFLIFSSPRFCIPPLYPSPFPFLASLSPLLVPTPTLFPNTKSKPQN